MSDISSIGQLMELWLDSEGHYVRIDLRQNSVTTAFKPRFSWHVDTLEERISHNLVHFVEPGGRIVGTKTFVGGYSHE